MNHVSLKKITLTALLIVLGLIHAAFIRAADDDPMDEYEPPPEGFEERHYPLASLIQVRSNPQNPYQGSDDLQPLTVSNVVEVLKYSVQPDSWTRRGAARIQVDGSDLVVLQRNEAHAEIAKVLKWLAEAATASARTTVVIANLKPDALKAFTTTGSATSAELFKAIDDAGNAAAAEVVELAGYEGHQCVSAGTTRRSYVRDFDVSGAVYDPVLGVATAGLIVRATPNRTPDGKSVQIVLQLSKSGIPEMAKAQISLDLPGVDIVTGSKLKDSIDDKTQVAPPAGDRTSARKAVLDVELPRQSTALLATTVTAARGSFVLAGTIDLTGSGGGRAAVFVRSIVGIENVPVLEGVSGLKEGESFRLYPLTASSRALRDFPGPWFWILPELKPIGVGAANGEPDYASPFTVAPPAVALQAAVFKSKQMFAEKVRKNRIVEVMGSYLFTRLNKEDHVRLTKTLSDDLKRRTKPARVRAIAVAVPMALQQRISLEGAGSIDAAVIDTFLKAEGAQVLTDCFMDIPEGFRGHSAAGVLSNIITDYEISGDSFDPVTRQVLDRGYSLELKAVTRADEASSEIEYRFSCIPGAAALERTAIGGIAVNSGASTNVVMMLRADLDRVRAGIVEFKGNISVPAGKFVIAGSARMPADQNGNADTRQVLLLLQADAAK